MSIVKSSSGSPGRRDEIIEATIRIVRRKGLAGASIRAIAHEVGQTMGVITHHFRDKSDLLCAALGSCFKPWNELIEQSRTIKNPADRLQHVMRATMSGEGHPVAQMQLWLGMLSQIDHDPQVANAYREQFAQTRADIAEILEQCDRLGQLKAGLDLQAEASHLLALADGLLVSSLGEPERYFERFLMQIMTKQVESLFA
jgi:AcrR family transcriptional regulator